VHNTHYRNDSVHSQDDFDDSLSGTTSISVYLHGNTNRITVSNVGDSRTIIGRQMQTSEVENGSSSSGGALKAFALSRDQTPYRRDERVRIRRTGGRILSLDQIEGLEPIREDEKERDEKALMNGGGEDIILGEEIDESGDPPRVWSPNGDYPGTAFTRSIGDAIAEELGVHADPEMLSRELTPEDKIIVIASDGVFEFLTNQSVIDICAKFSDPLEACRAVVAESYELWLQYELRTDDITIICLFLDSVDASKILRGPLALSTTEMVGESLNKDDALVSGSTRPVRKNISLEKSRALEKMKAEMNSVHDVTTETEEDFDMEALFNEKTEEEKTCIAEAIRASVVFQKITNSQRELLYKVMEPMKVKAGQWIIKQGTLGDRFYIVQFGTFEVRIVSEGAEDAEGTGGNVVHVYEGSREKDQHPCFGELALMYSTPRAASIIAKTDGMLWALHRFAFKKVTAERGSREGAVEILKKIDQLKGFSPDGLEDLASYLCEAKYAKGDVLIRQGEVGESIFVMLPGGGAEDLVQTKEDGSDERTLSDNDYFGEEILEMRSQKRYGSTVKATGKISCWTLSRSDVKRASRRSSKE